MRRLELGDTVGSRGSWDRAFEIYQGNSIFLTAFANFLLGQGALEEADDIAARALSLRQDAPNALFVKGLIEIARERPALVQKPGGGPPNPWPFRNGCATGG